MIFHCIINVTSFYEIYSAAVMIISNSTFFSLLNLILNINLEKRPCMMLNNYNQHSLGGYKQKIYTI